MPDSFEQQTEQALDRFAELIGHRASLYETLRIGDLIRQGVSPDQAGELVAREKTVQIESGTP